MTYDRQSISPATREHRGRKQYFHTYRFFGYMPKVVIYIMVLHTLLPIVLLIISSFSFRWTWPGILPQVWWHEKRFESSIPIGWDYIFSEFSGVGAALGNTLFIACCASLIGLLICFPAAMVTAEKDFRFKKPIEWLVYSPFFLPELILSTGMVLVSLRLNIAGSYPALITAHVIVIVPYIFKILHSSLLNISSEFVEQAILLGASPTRILFRIYIPLSLPGIVIAGLFSFLVSTNVFLINFAVGLGNIETLTTLLFSKLTGGSIFNSVTAGITILLIVPGMVFLAFTEKILRKEVFLLGTDKET